MQRWSSHKNQPFHRRVGFALSGLRVAFITEGNFRIQVIALLCIVGLLIVGRAEPVWWALVLLASGAVMTAELFNTAVENLTDHLHPDVHPQIRIVKDCAAAAVLVSATAAVGVAVAFLIHLFRSAG